MCFLSVYECTCIYSCVYRQMCMKEECRIIWCMCIYVQICIYSWSVYDIHTCFYVWCICDTHLCIYTWKCMHVWRMGKEKLRREKYVCICTYIDTWVCMSEFIYACIYRHKYVYVWVYVSVCLSIMHVYLCRHIHVFIHEYVYVCMGVHEQVHTCTFKCARVNLCVHGWCYLGGYNSFGCWYYYKQSFSPGR